MAERDAALVAADAALEARPHLFKAGPGDTAETALTRALLKQLANSTAAAGEANDTVTRLRAQLADAEAKAAEVMAEVNALLAAIPPDEPK